MVSMAFKETQRREILNKIMKLVLSLIPFLARIDLL